VAHPLETYPPKALLEVNAQILEIAAKLDALRPPEARLQQVLSALNNRNKAVTKLESELAAVDVQRAALLLQVAEAKAEAATFQTQLDLLQACAPPPPPLNHLTTLEHLLMQLGAPHALSAVKQTLHGLGVDMDAPPPPPPPPPGTADDAAMPQCATAPSPFGPAPTGSQPAFSATSKVSCFPLAADRAAIERARVLCAAAEAAQAASAGAWAHAATVTAQAERANAEAIAAATASAARAAEAAADAQLAADAESAAAAKRRRMMGGRARSLSRSLASSRRSPSGRRCNLASRSPRRTSPSRTRGGENTPVVDAH
jgi:hypothetical protein